jgi:hypothetical protein
MQKRTIGSAFLWLAFSLLSREAMAGGVMMTPVQTQSTSSGLVATNWGPGTSGITDPLVFNQFDPKLGTLTGIDVTLSFSIRNDYLLTFVNTPITTTMYLATSMTSNPSVLSDPAQRAMLTDGPTVTLFGPNGSGQLIGPPETRQPVDFVKMTETSGTWSSLLPITNPHFIPPTVTQQTLSLTLTAAGAPSLFSEFVGAGKVGLPVDATANSSFYSSTGNGTGEVLTTANASVQIQYVFTPLVIPEPSSAILLSLGIVVTVVACRRFPRRAGRGRMRDHA